jgi:PAS domain S-box-containing protein
MISVSLLPPIAGLVVILTGCLALVGWTAHIEAFLNVVPGMVTMKVNTALCFVLLGTALSLDSKSDRVWARTIATTCAVLVLVVCSVTLLEYISGRSWIDELFVRDLATQTATSSPGRMAVSTALNFILLALALLTTNVIWRVVGVHEVLALVAGSVSLTAFIGYAFGVRSLTGLVPYTHMAVHTMTAFIVLGTGILFLRPMRGLISIGLSAGPGGVMSRRLLPAAVAVPFLLSWLRLRGERASYYQTEFGIAILAISHILIFVALSWWVATILSREDMKHRQVTAALTKSEAKYRHLFEDSRDAIYITTRDGRFIDVNQAWLDLVGYQREDMLTLPVASLYRDPDARAQFQTAIEVEGTVRNYPVLFLRRDGAEIEVLLTATILRDEHGRLVGYHGNARDITEQKHLEEQLRQAQKMEAIGQLAGGVAHDFNNLLTVIGGRSYLILTKLESGDPLRRDIELIKGAAERAAGLTRQLLAFSRKQILEPRVLDLNTTTREIEGLLRRLLGEHIDIVVVPDPELGHVKADPGQIEQVIMNLAVNARDAMPEGGRLTLETSNAVLDETYARSHPTVELGRYACLAVTDSGHGMDAATQARIFEPFFTTKGVGKGTGLGLATVFGIVKQSGGHISVYSEPGHGTTFRVYLPRVDEATAAPPKTETLTRPHGTEVILLVEDEADVRLLARESLEPFGYTVLEAQNPSDAVMIARAHPGPIHLLLTDVILPQRSGRALANELAVSRPIPAVLFMSGYTADAIVHHGVLDEGTAFLQKPFTPAALANKVRETLDSLRDNRGSEDHPAQEA